MVGGIAMPPPEPARQAAEQWAAEQEAAEQRAAAEVNPAAAVDPTAARLHQIMAELDSAQQQAPEERLAQQRREAEEAARQQAPERQALDLSMSRKLVEASNSAAAVLETNAAYSRSVYDLPFFQEQAQVERQQFLIQMLTAAGRGLVDSFTDLINADEVWNRLALNERTLGQQFAKAPHPFRFRMELAELLTHHIPEMLITLGYHPPPPSVEWTHLVQDSVRRVLTASQDDARSGINAEKARQELIFFTRRLRSLVEAAEENLRRNEKNDESRSDALRQSLRTAVSAARNRAIPTALAAGASAAVGGIAGGPAGMGIAFLSGGAASLLASATEAAATRWLAEAGHEEGSIMSPASAVRADIEALDECIELLRSATSATSEGIRFIIRRGLFQTLQDAADSTVPLREFLWEWSRKLLLRLDEHAFSADEAHQIVDQARAAFARP